MLVSKSNPACQINVLILCCGEPEHVCIYQLTLRFELCNQRYQLHAIETGVK